jgi:hypothetical protein
MAESDIVSSMALLKLHNSGRDRGYEEGQGNEKRSLVGRRAKSRWVEASKQKRRACVCLVVVVVNKKGRTPYSGGGGERERERERGRKREREKEMREEEKKRHGGRSKRK